MHDPERRNKAIARQIKKIRAKQGADADIAPVFQNQEDPEAQNLLKTDA